MNFDLTSLDRSHLDGIYSEAMLMAESATARGDTETASRCLNARRAVQDEVARREAEHPNPWWRPMLKGGVA